MSDLSKIRSWKRLEIPFHASFQCQSGAAGYMMLVACLDIPYIPEKLLTYIQYCIEERIPELKGEFRIHIERVR